MIRALTVALALLAGPASADGAALFANHCAVCHGTEGRGDGPTSTWLIRKPADLTRLAVDNNGVFPVLRTLVRIDGRDPLMRSDIAMPAYGPVLGGEAVEVMIETGQGVLVPSELAEVLMWLVSIQED